MKRIRAHSRGESGLTLIEFLMAMGISSLILGALGMIVIQFSNLTRIQRASLTMDHELQNAATLLNGDAVSAIAGTVTVGAPTSTLVLYIPTYTFGQVGAPVTQTVTYTHSTSEGGLIRVDDSGPMTIARHIDSMDFGPAGPISITMRIALTTTIGDRSRNMAFTISRRPAH